MLVKCCSSLLILYSTATSRSTYSNTQTLEQHQDAYDARQRFHTFLSTSGDGPRPTLTKKEVGYAQRMNPHLQDRSILLWEAGTGGVS